jgi:hypothetical protein
MTDRGAGPVTAAREKVIELEDRRLAPLDGRRSVLSVELRDTLLTLRAQVPRLQRTPRLAHQGVCLVEGFGSTSGYAV